MRRTDTLFLAATFILLFTCTVIHAQKDVLQGINLGGEVGLSRLMAELPMDFSGTINEFNNKANLAFDFQLSKYFTPHLEIGIGINSAVLKGYAENPDFSAEGIYDSGLVPIGELNDPVEFKNRLIGQDLFFRYYLKRVDKQDYFFLNPFIKVGVGYINYMTELKDVNSGEAIPGAAKNPGKLTTGVMKIGTGFKAFLSKRLNLIASLDFNPVNYDYLDVVHNYNQSDERIEIIGVYTELKIGLYFNVTQFEAGKGRRKKYAIPEYHPFSPK